MRALTFFLLVGFACFAQVLYNRQGRLLNALHALVGEKEQLIEQIHNAQDQLVRSEKMAALGTLAAGVTHEICSPIAYAQSNLEIMQEYNQKLLTLVDAYQQGGCSLDESSDEVHEIERLKKELNLALIKRDSGPIGIEISEGLDSVSRIADDLKHYAHPGQEEWSPGDLKECIERAVNISWNKLKHHGEVHQEYSELPPVEMQPGAITQVAVNLLTNAAQAIGRSGQITVCTGSDKEMAWFEVGDTGGGIEEENIRQIFDPFFTTKPPGQGTGLGLAICNKIVHRHQGRIQVDSRPDKGTRFRIWLPIKQSASICSAESAVEAEEA